MSFEIGPDGKPKLEIGNGPIKFDLDLGSGGLHPVLDMGGIEEDLGTGQLSLEAGPVDIPLTPKPNPDKH